MRARLPDESGYVVNSGVRIHYEVHGTGQPTILLLPTWAIVDSRHWKMQVPSLDQGQVKNPDNYVGRILAAIFTLGIYMFWWFYNQMDEPNKHFTSNWAQEDELVTTVDAMS